MIGNISEHCDHHHDQCHPSHHDNNNYHRHHRHHHRHHRHHHRHYHRHHDHEHLDQVCLFIVEEEEIVFEAEKEQKAVGGRRQASGCKKGRLSLKGDVVCSK